MSDRQCSSCGGFCGRGGCKRENVKPEQKPVCFKCGHAWHPDECVNTAPPARKPLSDERIDQIIASNVTITDRNLYGAVYMAIREVEQAHGINEK